MGICDIPGISSVCNSVGEGAASLVAAPFDWLAAAMGKAAGWLVEAVWMVFDTTTVVDVTRGEYLKVYNILFGVAVVIMLIFFTLQLITGLLHRDPTALAKAATGLAKSVLGSFVVITITAALLEIVDQLCIGIVHASGQTIESMGSRIALLVGSLTAINIAVPGVGAIITIFLAGLAIGAAAIVWLSLLIRKALLLVAIVLAPIALSGASWTPARGWISKWAMFVVALAVSKLVLVVMFLVATTQVSAPIDKDLASISEPIAGVVVMAMAGFAPYLTYKFVSFIGIDMYHAMSVEQEAKSALNRPIPTPSSQPSSPVQKILDGSSSDKRQSKNPPQSPPVTSTPGASTGGTGTGAAASGASGSSGAASAGSSAGAGAAAAGPAAAVVVGAQIIKTAATAGPKLGAAVGAGADSQAGAASTSTGSAPGPESASPQPPPSPPAPVPQPTSAPAPQPRPAPSQKPVGSDHS